MRDEILIQEAREQLLDCGLDIEDVDEQVAVMADEGMFDIPEDWS